MEQMEVHHEQKEERYRRIIAHLQAEKLALQGWLNTYAGPENAPLELKRLLDSVARDMQKKERDGGAPSSPLSPRSPASRSASGAFSPRNAGSDSPSSVSKRMSQMTLELENVKAALVDSKSESNDLKKQLQLSLVQLQKPADSMEGQKVEEGSSSLSLHAYAEQNRKLREQRDALLTYAHSLERQTTGVTLPMPAPAELNLSPRAAKGDINNSNRSSSANALPGINATNGAIVSNVNGINGIGVNGYEQRTAGRRTSGGKSYSSTSAHSEGLQGQQQEQQQEQQRQLQLEQQEQQQLMDSQKRRLLDDADVAFITGMDMGILGKEPGRQGGQGGSRKDLGDELKGVRLGSSEKGRRQRMSSTDSGIGIDLDSNDVAQIRYRGYTADHALSSSSVHHAHSASGRSSGAPGAISLASLAESDGGEIEAKVSNASGLIPREGRTGTEKNNEFQGMQQRASSRSQGGSTITNEERERARTMSQELLELSREARGDSSLSGTSSTTSSPGLLSPSVTQLASESGGRQRAGTQNHEALLLLSSAGGAGGANGQENANSQARVSDAPADHLQRGGRSSSAASAVSLSSSAAYLHREAGDSLEALPMLGVGQQDANRGRNSTERAAGGGRGSLVSRKRTASGFQRPVSTLPPPPPPDMDLDIDPQDSHNARKQSHSSGRTGSQNTNLGHLSGLDEEFHLAEAQALDVFASKLPLPASNNVQLSSGFQRWVSQ